MNLRRRILLMVAVAAGVGAVGAFGSKAWAHFSASGSGTASAAVATLGTPSAVTAPASVVGDTVSVSWTGVTAPGGSSTVAYWVRRYSGSTPTDACGSSHASPIAEGSGAQSCTDSDVAPGTYTYTVTAVFRSWTNESAASDTVTVVAGLDHFAVAAPTSATAGSAFAVTVTAEDSSDHAVAGYAGTISFTSSDAGAALPADYTFVGGDNGSHTFSSQTTLTTTGSQTVSVHDIADTAKTGTSAGIAVSAGALDHFTVTTPVNATAGNSFTTATLRAQDVAGNPASGWTSATKCVAFSGPANAPNGTAPSYPSQGACAAGQSSLSFDGSGQASGFAITLFKSQSVALTATASTKTGTAPAITVAAAGLDHFAVTAPASATVATTVSSATVAARDLYDNAASGWTSATKCVVLSGPGSAPNGTAPNYPSQGSCAAGQSSLAFDGSGQASGFGITLYKAEVHSLTATDPSSSKTGTSGNVTVAAGSAASFAVGAPASANAGAPFSVTSLTARDAYNNTATSYTGSHTIAWSGPGNAPNGQAPSLPATTVSFTSGVSTTALNATLYKAESATLNASETSGPSGSASVSVSPLGASNFLVSAPASVTAGTSFSATSLTARDLYNNTVTSYTGSHTITWSGPGTSPSGTAPTLPATNVSFTAGVSTTALTATLTKAENATLTAATSSPTVTGSTTITVGAGTAAQLAWSSPSVNSGTLGSCVFTCSWTSAGKNNKFTAAVAVTDANGNVVSNVGAGHTVGLTKTGGGSFSTTTLALPASGLAVTSSFTYTTENNNGWSTDTITAASSGFSSATVAISR